MIEAKNSGDKGIMSRAVKNFPQHFWGNYNDIRCRDQSGYQAFQLSCLLRHYEITILQGSYRHVDMVEQSINGSDSWPIPSSGNNLTGGSCVKKLLQIFIVIKLPFRPCSHR